MSLGLLADRIQGCRDAIGSWVSLAVHAVVGDPSSAADLLSQSAYTWGGPRVIYVHLGLLSFNPASFWQALDPILTRGVLMSNELPFSYQAFSDWYDSHKRKYLDTARDAATRVLSEYFEDKLSEMEGARVRITGGRVKSKARTWRKLNLPKYRDVIHQLDEVPEIIDDLVGIRITCNNQSDVVRVRDLIKALPVSDGVVGSVLAQEEGSWKDYANAPKATGYRAVHVNLQTAVSLGVEWHLVTCELQVRTLLQDGWGELTHEDTYKPGSEPPALVRTLSRRMADLLAAVDDIAQDLREELDRLSSVAVGELSEKVDFEIVDEGQLDVESGAGDEAGSKEAAMRYLRERLDGLNHPVDLASLAWEVQREFGQEVSQGWFGFESFKALVRASSADVTISDRPPAYVIPADFVASSAVGLAASSLGIPDVALALKENDKSFPLIGRDQLIAAYERLSLASQEMNWADPMSDFSRINDMTRRARQVQTVDVIVSRPNLDYISKALLHSRNLRGPLVASKIKEIYSSLIIKRVADIAPLENGDELALRGWLA
ncbi:MULTISPECIES: GTP pyrophosphokinase [Streptomycetaceae]|uniref:GTP pyrophosphokinase n=1 Tax=Streptomycetaceae TaxID=2062 RepID=UPI00131DA20A